MTRAAFIGHYFHHKTKSSAFFKAFLAQHFETIVDFDFDPEMPHAFDYRGLLADPFDAYFYWQSEPVLDSVGALTTGATYIIPMYDSAVLRKLDYWRLHSDRVFISFSQALHATLQEAGCTSILVQYYPQPMGRRWRPETGLSGFFWERRPETEYDADCVIRAAADLGLQALHIHLAPDSPIDTAARQEDIAGTAARRAPKLSVSFSTWFERKEDLIAAAARHPIYFAPRIHEGIGMGFLEAMAMGQVVVGPDAPTLNEYVADGHNGLLLGPDLRVPRHIALTPEVAARLSDRSLGDVALGWRRWQEDSQRLSRVLTQGLGAAEADAGTAFTRQIRAAAGARAAEARGDAP